MAAAAASCSVASDVNVLVKMRQQWLVNKSLQLACSCWFFFVVVFWLDYCCCATRKFACNFPALEMGTHTLLASCGKHLRVKTQH